MAFIFFLTRPKIDRLACPWLIKRFVDKKAEIIYVPFDQVMERAHQLKATPFDVPGVEFTHYGTECTFDYFIKKYKIKDRAVLAMASIVRGADTDHPELFCGGYDYAKVLRVKEVVLLRMRRFWKCLRRR